MCYEISTKHKERSQYQIPMPAPLRTRDTIRSPPRDLGTRCVLPPGIVLRPVWPRSLASDWKPDELRYAKEQGDPPHYDPRCLCSGKVGVLYVHTPSCPIGYLTGKARAHQWVIRQFMQHTKIDVPRASILGVKDKLSAFLCPDTLRISEWWK